MAAGDLVLATNPEAGAREAKRVEQAFRRTSDHLRILRFEGAGGQQELKTTNEHPFWVPAAGKFVPAGELSVGDTVTGPRGELQRVAATEYEAHPEGVRVYNFRVADFHSYYVAAQGTRAPPVLVHNGTCKTFIDEMTPDEAARYKKYWEQGDHDYGDGTRFRGVSPDGSRSVIDQKLSKTNPGELYPRETIFDDLGRNIGNNDLTDHGLPGHPNPHHHLRDPITGQLSGPLPGLHPQTPQ